MLQSEMPWPTHPRLLSMTPSLWHARRPWPRADVAAVAAVAAVAVAAAAVAAAAEAAAVGAVGAVVAVAEMPSLTP